MDFADEALKMAGALAMVVALLLGGLVVLKRFIGDSQGGTGSPLIRMLGGLRLGQGKTIMLVEVAGEILVLGTTPRNLTLLTCVDDIERVKQLRTLPERTFSRLGSWTSGLWNTPAERRPALQDNQDDSCQKSFS